MVEPESPILRFYPENFVTDLNGKQQEWEAVVLLPFIEQVSWNFERGNIDPIYEK